MTMKREYSNCKDFDNQPEKEKKNTLKLKTKTKKM